MAVSLAPSSASGVQGAAAPVGATPPPFVLATRLKQIPYGNLIPAGSVPAAATTWNLQLPKTGFLALVLLSIRGSLTGTLTAPNALGFASVISRVKLTANSGVDLVSLSGAGYFFLLSEVLESEYFNVALGVTNTLINARSPVTAAAFTLDMVIPIMINLRDPIGLLLLQNEQSIITLSMDTIAPTAAATGATYSSLTANPYLHLFTVPPNPQSWPRLDLVHSIIEEQQTVTGLGDFAYNLPRGNVYLQLLQGLGIAATATDSWSTTQGVVVYKWRVNQSDFIVQASTDYMDMIHRYYRGRARPLGGIYVIDQLASSGLGNYGLARDLFNSALVTDCATVLTVGITGTMFIVRRQLISLS